MNKRYIDFVPSKSKGGATRGAVTEVMPSGGAVRPAASARSVVGARRVATQGASAVRRTQPVRPVESARRVRAVRRVRPAQSAERPVASASVAVEKGLPLEKAPTLGVVEDLNAKFVRTDVPKRPLSQQSELAAAKAKRVKIKGTGEAAVKPTSKGAVVDAKASANVKAEETYKTPKSPFINQHKVVKRPLSKNVYQKKVETPKEEPKGPVTIIAKPEKDSHVGIIVTIIITIILGAAAGTVAFLLLPK